MNNPTAIIHLKNERPPARRDYLLMPLSTNMHIRMRALQLAAVEITAEAERVLNQPANADEKVVLMQQLTRCVGGDASKIKVLEP